MPETICYILDGENPVPCDDITVWQEWMNDLPKRTVAFDRVGKIEILTTFIGINIGNAARPKFFKMTVFGGNEGDPPICTATWKQAMAKHKAMVKAATRITQREQTNQAIPTGGFKAIGCEVLANEIRFLLESEEAAIKAHPKKIKNWFREGRTIIFRPEKSSATESN